MKEDYVRDNTKENTVCTLVPRYFCSFDIRRLLPMSKKQKFLGTKVTRMCGDKNIYVCFGFLRLPFLKTFGTGRLPTLKMLNQSPFFG